MAKLKTTNPLTGAKEDLSAETLIGKVLWIAGTIMIFAFTQNVLKKVQKTVPGIDTTIDPLISTPAAAYSGPVYMVA